MGNNKNRSSTSSLPIDVIADDILSRLPVKSLSRFKCVSKEWLNLISSPYFKHLHTQKNYQRKPFLFLWNKTKPDYRPQWEHFFPGGFAVGQQKTDSVDLRLSVVDVVNEKLHHEFDAYLLPMHMVAQTSSALRRAMQFSHKVVCCRSLVFFWRSDSVCVCNPSTNEFVTLPSDYFEDLEDYQSCVFGFGYNPPTNEYKIVAWINLFEHVEVGHDNKDECLVFTLTDGGRATSGSWRWVELQNRLNLHLDEDSVCVNGTIYWKVEMSDDLNSVTNDSGYGSLIKAFELETEVSNVIGCPFGQLVELKGKLCSAESLPEELSLKIWMLKDPKSGVWVEEWNIHLPAPRCRWSESIFSFPIAYYHHDEEEHLILVSWSWPSELLYYNINTNRVTKANKLMGLTRKKGTHVYWDGFFSLGT